MLFRKSRLLKADSDNNIHVTNKDQVIYIICDREKMYHLLQPQNKEKKVSLYAQRCIWASYTE